MPTITVRAADPMARDAGFVTWLRAQGLNPEHMYQIDIDGLSATVYEYATKGGKHYIDPATHDAARRKPRKVALKSKLNLEVVK